VVDVLDVNGLENPYYKGNPNCIYNKTPTAEESINQIKLNLRRQKMKYSNKKTQVDMYVFDSALEAKRYRQLALLEKAGEIKNLKLQVPFLLQESFRKNGKTYRKIEYISDFVYEENGKTIVEDTKGMKTDVFKIKQKLFEYKYPNLSLKIVTKEEI
jgi:hypothetical protein